MALECARMGRDILGGNGIELGIGVPHPCPRSLRTGWVRVSTNRVDTDM